MSAYYFKSPLGPIKVELEGTHITSVSFQKKTVHKENKTPLPRVLQEFEDYFLGKQMKFRAKYKLKGTPFQKRVWVAVSKIPFGETRTYQEIAEEVGSPKASRAVGMANRNNPLPLVIPCHRVIGKSGKLIGYNGGLDKKSWLLQHEGVLS